MNSEFERYVGASIDTAERYDDNRQDLFDRYMGELYGNEKKGQSQVITSECFDTVEMATAELVDLLASDDRIAAFKAESEQDEDQAELETDAVNHVFWDKNNGYESLQAYIRQGLIEQNAYIFAGWRKADRVDVQNIQSEGDEELERSIREIANNEGTETEDTEDGLRLTSITEVDEYVVEPISQNRIRMTPQWHKVSVQDVPFVAIEHDTLTRADLKAMGFDPDQVDALTSEDHDDDDDNRHHTKDSEGQYENSTERDQERVPIYECYVLYEKGGTQRRYKAWYGNNQLMRWASGEQCCEPVVGVPIYPWTPIPVPFRHIGRSMVEVVDDLQAINTNLTRNLLDNLYKTNHARPIVNPSFALKETFSDIANASPGAAIRYKSDQMAFYAPPSLIGNILPVLDRNADVLEQRSGITRLNQGLDADTLNKTASGQAQLLSQGAKRLKLIARNAAESIAELMLGIHRDLRAGNWDTLTFKSGGTWTQTSPATWQPRTRMMVSVGTGNGDRAEKMHALNMIGNVQRELLQSGSPMVDDSHVFETADRMMKAFGYPGVGAFMLRPGSPEYRQKVQAAQSQPPEPDPALILAEAERQKAVAQATKAEVDAQLALAKLDADREYRAQEHERKMAELELRKQEISLGATKAAMDFETKSEAQDLAEEKFDHQVEMDVIDRVTP